MSQVANSRRVSKVIGKHTKYNNSKGAANAWIMDNPAHARSNFPFSREEYFLELENGSSKLVSKATYNEYKVGDDYVFYDDQPSLGQSSGFDNGLFFMLVFTLTVGAFFFYLITS